MKEKQSKPEEPSVPANSGIVAGSIDSSLDLEEVKDGVARFNFELKNQTPNMVTLHYDNGMKFDFLIKDVQGKEVFHFSKEMMTTQALVQDTVKQGELLTFLVETPKLENGTYTIEVWSTSREFKEAKVSAEFEVK